MARYFTSCPDNAFQKVPSGYKPFTLAQRAGAPLVSPDSSSQPFDCSPWHQQDLSNQRWITLASKFSVACCQNELRP